MIEAFRATFGRLPTHRISAPGRVNLIGEHTDYNGYPVLPMSIPFAVRALASPREDRTVRIRNTQSGFPPRDFQLASSIAPSEPGDWSNYVKAAASRLVEQYGDSLRGVDILFSGDVPSSAGLSSSSALVVASALSLLTVGGIPYDAVELAEMMAEGERYVGTQGGGMDQAVCLLGAEGKAVRLDFFPLRYTHVGFPAEHSIVVAHSLVRAAKTENALLLYNRRPAECRIAVAVINRMFPEAPPLVRLGDLPKRGVLKRFDSIGSFLDRVFPEESYNLSEAADLSGMTPDELTRRCLMTRLGIPMPAPEDGFRIRSRVRHVLSEAERVDRSCDVLEHGDADEFGHLMNESHRSCDLDYGISTPELNTLASMLREAGALGARLTGAGFGGCAVALVRDRDVESVVEAVRRKYYGEYIPRIHPEFSREGALFAAKPSRGASVETL